MAVGGRFRPPHPPPTNVGGSPEAWSRQNAPRPVRPDHRPDPRRYSLRWPLPRRAAAHGSAAGRRPRHQPQHRRPGLPRAGDPRRADDAAGHRHLHHTRAGQARRGRTPASAHAARRGVHGARGRRRLQLPRTLSTGSRNSSPKPGRTVMSAPDGSLHARFRRSTLPASTAWVGALLVACLAIRWCGNRRDLAIQRP